MLAGSGQLFGQETVEGLVGGNQVIVGDEVEKLVARVEAHGSGA